jgi:hypothetical protein
MSINGCTYSFAELAAIVLPAHMARLKDAIQQPWSASIFSQPGRGVVAITEQLNLESDFSGCYVLLDGTQPIYVGISRSVLNRLRQHLLGKDHFGASLAFAMARKRHNGTLGTVKR